MGKILHREIEIYLFFVFVNFIYTIFVISYSIMVIKLLKGVKNGTI